ncbi:MAG TPA: GGDEF domain-containing protein, partial [Lachnospiraceae bacterium]|nr:GGDEF domain-containing protein [Lachnospiraceae bacterium]
EEFIVLGETPVCSDKVLEELRKKIAEEVFRFEKNEIRITVTIGSSKYQNGMTNDNWISSADNKLYKGKSNGKNQVVY